MIANGKSVSLHGAWQVGLKDGSVWTAQVPGSLDENGIGYEDQKDCETRLTRVHTYEGPAAFARDAVLRAAEGERLFLYVERARLLQLTVDGMPVARRSGSLSTPWTFELTGWADGKAHHLVLVSDNNYPGLPRKAIVYSSAATDETQTNWNGLLGEVSLRTEPSVFVDAVRLLMKEDGARVCVTLDAAADHEGELTLRGDAFGEVTQAVKVGPGRTDVTVPVTIDPAAPRWDELDGRLCDVSAELKDLGTWTQRTGLRTFGCSAEDRLHINGRVFFLRGEANCCEFPEEGHTPMTVEAWREVLKTYAAYGVNCMRFHSHCPPDAAFTAADELGMMMQPELSHWDPWNAFESEESFRYYREELASVIRALGHHPSFVMLSLGNELHANEEGRARMRDLLDMAARLDDTRLFAWGSNNFYGRRRAVGCGGFYTSMACGDEMLRATSPNLVGQLNNGAPSTDYTFDAGMALVRGDYAGPVFGFEAGQYEVLPDFGEIDTFHGVTRAVNYAIVRDRVKAHGMDAHWNEWVEATGELSVMCYREEVEAALRTRGMSGLSLLGLQDFPGQGTALVGMLNAHLRPKPFPFAQPERFAAFYRPVLPLAMLPSRTFACGDTVTVPLALANYGKETLSGVPAWELSGDGVTLRGALPEAVCPCGRVTDLGEARIPLDAWTASAALTLTVRVAGQENSYPLWVYEDAEAEVPEDVRVTQDVQEALTLLREGERVLLTPPATREAVPGAITSQFSSDFWSVGNFPEQEGAMGLLIDAEHPALAGYPTKTVTTWPWWQMAKGRAMFIPERLHPIVRVLDCYKYLRHLSLLAEVRVGEGRLMLSGMGLLEHLDRVEVRALYRAILDYMGSDAFLPQDELSEEELMRIFGKE